jgi:mutator protein MutT
LLNFFRVNKPSLTIIFANTKRRVEEIEKTLKRNRIYCDYIHSGLSQARRNRVINKFRCQQIKTLIATDVAARGIHVNNISHVINYDFPQNLEFYTHRIGRTGRAGASGKAITFLSSFSEKSQLTRICREKNYKIERLEFNREKDEKDNETGLTKVIAAIIQDENGLLLASQRSLKSEIGAGQWQTPGGKVETGESREEALKREVKEETDLDVKSVGKLLFRFIDKKNKFDIYFYKVETTGKPKTKEPNKLNSG